MKYTLVDFAKSLRLDACSVRRPPAFIFLCGGPVSKKGRFKSARDFFNRRLTSTHPDVAKRVRLAEVINSGFRRDDAFPDLLALESHLAHISELVLLFVESPGAIAELGAFIASDSIRPRTLAVLNEGYGFEKTFIADGPVKKLKNELADRVQYYNWNPRSLNSPATLECFDEMASELVKYLQELHDGSPAEVGFQPSNVGHLSWLCADLIRLQGVALRTDLLECFEAIGAPLTHASLSQHLSLLESVDLIYPRPRGPELFFVPKFEQPVLHYGYNRDARMKDWRRIELSVRAGLEARRHSLLKDVLKKASNV